jgi:hypothetical protein
VGVGWALKKKSVVILIIILIINWVRGSHHTLAGQVNWSDQLVDNEIQFHSHVSVGGVGEETANEVDIDNQFNPLQGSCH